MSWGIKKRSGFRVRPGETAVLLLGWGRLSRDDNSVWIAIRSFSRPSNRWWWAMYPLLRLAQEPFLRRYLRALAGPMTATVPR